MLDAGSRVVPGQWIFVGSPGRETEHIKGWLCYNLEEVFPKGERVFYHVWFLESMEHRFDSLTRFDRDLLERGSSPGHKPSRYERLAEKVRGMYRQCNDMESAGTVIVDNFELTFAESTRTPVSEGSLPSINADQTIGHGAQATYSATAETDHSLLLLQQLTQSTLQSHQVPPTCQKVDQHTGHDGTLTDHEEVLSLVGPRPRSYPLQRADPTATLHLAHLSVPGSQRFNTLGAGGGSIDEGMLGDKRTHYSNVKAYMTSVSYTHLRAHET